MLPFQAVVCGENIALFILVTAKPILKNIQPIKHINPRIKCRIIIYLDDQKHNSREYKKKEKR